MRDCRCVSDGRCLQCKTGRLHDATVSGSGRPGCRERPDRTRAVGSVNPNSSAAFSDGVEHDRAIATERIKWDCVERRANDVCHERAVTEERAKAPPPLDAHARGASYSASVRSSWAPAGRGKLSIPVTILVHEHCALLPLIASTRPAHAWHVGLSWALGHPSFIVSNDSACIGRSETGGARLGGPRADASGRSLRCPRAAGARHRGIIAASRLQTASRSDRGQGEEIREENRYSDLGRWWHGVAHCEPPRRRRARHGGGLAVEAGRSHAW